VYYGVHLPFFLLVVCSFVAVIFLPIKAKAQTPVFTTDREGFVQEIGVADWWILASTPFWLDLF
jgi:hypothetical protein